MQRVRQSEPTDGLVAGLRITAHLALDHRHDVFAVAARIFLEHSPQVVHVACGDDPQEHTFVRSPAPEGKKKSLRAISASAQFSYSCDNFHACLVSQLSSRKSTKSIEPERSYL